MAEIVLSFYSKHPVPNQLEMHLDPLTKGIVLCPFKRSLLFFADVKFLGIQSRSLRI